MSSYIDWVRAFCLSLPHATEGVQWEHDLLFRIAGKMFCVANLEPGLSPTKIAFKCTPETFAELVEIEGVVPAPYMARNHWVAILEMDALRRPELEALVRNSYQLVREKLPKKTLAGLEATPATAAAGRKTKPKQAVQKQAKPKQSVQKAKPKRAARKAKLKQAVKRRK
jgi:predicted DNA-binding protein (MmcQ/YjbR family)